MALARTVGGRRPWGRLATIAVAVCCAVTGTTSPAGAADTWPSDTAGGANTSSNPDATAITTGNVARLELAWSDESEAGAYPAPAVVNGKVFRADSTAFAGTTSPFEVRSARTGALLWSIDLPDLAFYHQGVTVDPARGLAVVSFKGSGRPHGLLAVDLVRHSGSRGGSTCRRTATGGRRIRAVRDPWCPTAPAST